MWCVVVLTSVEIWEDFLKNQKSTRIGSIKPTYQPGVTLSNLNELLPPFVADTLKQGIDYFDIKLPGFANPDSLLTGIESRSSSPVKILRNEKLTSNVTGLYPCGEGAGYAGRNHVSCRRWHKMCSCSTL